ncbi:MAG: FAD-binding oxidoreductase, partial [Rhodospirillales bacterium]
MAFTTLRSLDGQFKAVTDIVRPDRVRQLQAIGTDQPIAPRGAGLSLSAMGFGNAGRTVGMDRFDRFKAYDAETGHITVESGATLGNVSEFLLSKGRLLPAQPGHPGISVGGSIANNVHGKNPCREGTFVDWVESLRLFHPDYGILHLSRQEKPEIFDLTCGGFGLTGIIIDATLRTEPLNGNAYGVKRQ